MGLWCPSNTKWEDVAHPALYPDPCCTQRIRRCTFIGNISLSATVHGVVHAYNILCKFSLLSAVRCIAVCSKDQATTLDVLHIPNLCCLGIRVPQRSYNWYNSSEWLIEGNNIDRSFSFQLEVSWKCLPSLGLTNFGVSPSVSNPCYGIRFLQTVNFALFLFLPIPTSKVISVWIFLFLVRQ